MENEEYQPLFRVLSNIVVIGLIMATLMVIMSFTTDLEVISLDTPKDITSVTTIINNNESTAKLFIAIDTFFIAGYTALFIGAYYLTKEYSKEFSKIALLLGLTTTWGDLIENSMLFAIINGIPEGWTPDSILFVYLWSIGFLIDITSYVSTLFFALMIMNYYPKLSKFHIFGILLILYATVGFLALLYPLFMLVRSLFFVIGLAYAFYAFYTY